MLILIYYISHNFMNELVSLKLIVGSALKAFETIE